MSEPRHACTGLSRIRTTGVCTCTLERAAWSKQRSGSICPLKRVWWELAQTRLSPEEQATFRFGTFIVPETAIFAQLGKICSS